MDGRTSPFSKAELVYPSLAFGLYASLTVLSMTDDVDNNLKTAVKHENHEEMGQNCR